MQAAAPLIFPLRRHKTTSPETLSCVSPFTLTRLPCTLGEMLDSAPGVILAGLQGSSGKTAISCLLLAAWTARALRVQPFKVGPDFIDPAYHNRFGTLPSRNIDTWLMGGQGVCSEILRHGTPSPPARGPDLCLVEGVLGLFDGASPVSEEGSTMELARWTGWPIVLCLPAAKAGRSLAASVRGFLTEAHPDPIAGVILNGISGDSHAAYLREALAPLNIPVLGAVPQHELLRWEERHLGLQAAPEGRLPSPADLRVLAEATLDVEALRALARPLRPEFAQRMPDASPAPRVPAPLRAPRVAIAEDAAFHFYYATNKDWLLEQGAELIPFSPLHSSRLPANPDAILLGGGFPELFAERIAANTALLKSLREAVDAGVPCYAECGGLMLLSQAIQTAQGRRFPMAGVVPGTMEMRPALQHFGYCTAQDAHRNAVRGHEFHHASWRNEAESANAWTVTRRRTGTSRPEGFRSQRLHASFVHVHFPSHPEVMRSLLSFTP